MNKEQFAEKIIRLRKKKGYTQAQLAELLNVSNKAVSRWETAEGYPDITLLKPLSEALGISCDELLGDTKGYSDLSRYDLQRYLPYGLTLLALLLYYVFLKLQISQLLSFAAFLGMMVFSNVLMIQHTDKRALPSLTRWNLLLAYFPLVSFLQYLYILYLFLQLGFSNILEILAMQTEEFHPYSFFVSGYETGVTIYLLMYVAALLVLAVVYGCLRHTFIMRYDISWNGLHKGVHGKEQEEKNILFRKWSDKGEAVLRIVMPLAAGLTLLAFGILLFQEYRSLCGSCLLQLLAIMKSKRVLYYISNVSVLFLYGVITLLFTTIVDRFYIKLPFAFAIPAGIGMIMWYCRDILQKKGKHGTGNKKT